MASHALEVAALIKAGVFRSQAEAVDEAVRVLLMTRPQLRVEAAIQLFKDAAVTLGRAAEIAGATRWEFEALLTDRGITRIVVCDAAADPEQQGETQRRNA